MARTAVVADRRVDVVRVLVRSMTWGAVAGAVTGAMFGAVAVPEAGARAALVGIAVGLALGGVNGLPATIVAGGTRTWPIAATTAGCGVVLSWLPGDSWSPPSGWFEPVLAAACVMVGFVFGPVSRAPLPSRRRPTGSRLVTDSLWLGTVCGTVTGAILGLVVGLSAYPPTAAFAAVELGFPAALLGLILGTGAGLVRLAATVTVPS